MQKETKRDTDAIVERIHNLTVEAGLLPKGWRTVLEEGSPTYGRGWELYASPGDSYGLYRHPAVGSNGAYVGWSRREANEKMRLIIQIVGAMGRTKKENRQQYGYPKNYKVK